MANGNRSLVVVESLPAPRRVYTEVEIYSHHSLLDLLLLILSEKRTGSLTINFAGGKPDGTAEWKRHMRQPPNIEA